MTATAAPNVEKAYGHLWRVGNSPRASAARKLLLATIDKEGQRRGIEATHGEPGEKAEVAVTAIWLKRIGDHVIVEAEIGGRWVEVIRERHDGNYSHIVESGGIMSAFLKGILAA